MADRRYEFRFWPTQSGTWEKLFDDWETGAPEQRTDIYILPPAAELMPKLRDKSRFEIKQLLTTRKGFEYWDMAVSASWPLSKKELARVRTIWPAAEKLLDAKNIEAFLTKAEKKRKWRIASVAKARQRYYLGFVRGEFTHVDCEGREAVTIAFEAPRLADLRKALKGWPLDDVANRSYRDWIIGG